MSSFTCSQCSTHIIDTPKHGYVTFCEHYPPEKKTASDKLKHDLPDFMKDLLFPND